MKISKKFVFVNGLEFRMMLPAVIFILIFSALFVLLNNHYTARLLDNRLEREAIRISNILYESRFALNSVYLKRLGKVIEGEIAVFDSTGKIIAASFDTDQPNNFSDLIDQEQLRNQHILKEAKQIIQTIKKNQHSFLIVSTKLFFYNTKNSIFIAILTAMDDLESTKSHIILRTLLSGGLALLIAFFFTRLILKKILTSVDHMIHATKQIASGDFQYKAPPSEIRELNVLATSVNQMSDQLVEFKTKLIDSTRIRSASAITTAMAHEIKNPLSSMKMLSQIIEKRLKNDQQGTQMIAAIIKEINRVDRLVSDLKTLTAPSKLSCTQVAPHTPINEIIEVILPKINHLNITLETDINQTLPDILMDNDKIKQVLWNLMMNGAQSMPNGGTLKVWLHEKANTNQIEYGIEDKGCGITQENMETVFTPFFTTKTEGIGIGLSVSREITEAHHGELTLISSSEGTTAKLILPCQHTA
ncbi:MAG: ATP-binding protein [Pseudomonadota bacterium]